MLLKSFNLRVISTALLVAICCSARGQNNFDSVIIEPFPIYGGALKISEVMFDPVDGGADYVECFCNYPDTLVSDSFCVVRWIGDSMGRTYPFPPGRIMPPQSYVVLTVDTDFVLSHYHVENPELLIPMAALPPYPNDKGTVLIYTVSGTWQDRFDYSASMHHPLLENKENVALERHSFLHSASDPSNWHSASSVVGYGTPTAPNSQGYFLNDLAIELASPIFSPDGDGYEDQLDIDFKLPERDLSGNVTILDAQGRPVRRLLKDGTLGSYGTLTWDGLDDRGRRCPRGTYIIAFEIYSPKGFRSLKRLAVSIVY